MFGVQFIVGARDTGKSTLARFITRKEIRRITLDPSRDWEKRGVRAVKSLKALSSFVAANWKAGFHVTYTPPPGQEPLALHRVSEMAFAYQEKLYRGKAADELLIVVDEMAAAYNNAHASRSDLGGFSRAILQGRHVGLSVCGITQRPADVAARFRDMAEPWYILALHDHVGRDNILKKIGPEHAGALRGLTKGEYLSVHGSTVTKGKLTRQELAASR